MPTVYVSARLKDVVSSAAQLHGWDQVPAVNVNIANIPLPTADERAEMRQLDAKLDAFASLLPSTAPGRRALVCGARVYRSFRELQIPRLYPRTPGTLFGLFRINVRHIPASPIPHGARPWKTPKVAILRDGHFACPLCFDEAFRSQQLTPHASV